MFDENKLLGTFVVLYGGHNLGKTTQAKRLVKLLRKEHRIAVLYLKYPVLELEPTGSRINSYLRGGNPQKISPQQFQLLQVVNKFQAQEKFVYPWLVRGGWVIAEDYVGTAIAWSRATGLEEKFIELLDRIHKKYLIEPNISFVFKGRRFTEAVEKQHIHEPDDELVKRAYDIHIQLGKELGWFSIYANQSRDGVTQDILRIIQQTQFS